MDQTKNKQTGLQGSLKLAGESFEQATSRVHEFHRAVSDMPFKAVGTATLSASKPVQVAHDEITDLVYDVVKTTGRSVLDGAAWMAGQWRQTSASASVMDRALDGELSHHALIADRESLPGAVNADRTAQRLSRVSSAVHGLVGDHLAASRNPIQIRAGFYQNARLVDLSEAGLSASFPEATNHLVVFAHGLCCDESVWQLYHKPEDPLTLPYGDKLAARFGVTPVYLRYNTGLNIEANGRRYKRLLKRLILNWPVPVQSLTLVGHSMGGLVSRVAVQDMGEQDRQLESVIRDVISLGSPHTGSPVARLAEAGEQFFNRFELSRPLAKVLGVRSTGIRNLQEGIGPLHTKDGTKVSFHLMGATVAGHSGSWINESIGDGLVQMSSALADETGKAQRLAFSAKHHMMLVNDHEIYQQLEAVIAQHMERLPQ